MSTSLTMFNVLRHRFDVGEERYISYRIFTKIFEKGKERESQKSDLE